MTQTTSTLSDGRLVRLAKAGDTGAFEKLIERHAGLVFMIARARLGDAEIAEDLVQEVFLRVHLHLHQLGDPDRLAPWLASLTRNLAIDWKRRGQRRSQLVPMVPLEEAALQVPDTRTRGAREAMASDEQRQAVLAAIDKLPAEQREVVLLHFIEDLKQVEIAERLGVRPNHVHRLLRRALASLRGMVEPALRGAAPDLRIPRRVVARTSLLVATAAALSVASRQALSAAAAASMPLASISKAKAGAVGVATVGAAAKSGLVGLVQSVWASLATGGTLMGLGKGVVITAVVAAAGVIGYNHFKSPEKPSSVSEPAVQTNSTAAPSAAAASPEVVQLACNLPAGLSYRSTMQVDLAQETAMLPPGLDQGPVRKQVHAEVDSTSRVLDRTPDGSVRLETVQGSPRFSDLQLTVNGRPAPIPPQGDPLAEFRQNVGDLRTLTTFDRAGGVTGFELTRAQANAVSPADTWTLSEIVVRALGGYPDHPVSPGDTWTQEVSLPPTLGGRAAVIGRLDRVEEREGRRVAVVHREAQFALSQPMPVPSGWLGGSVPPTVRAELSELRGQIAMDSQLWVDTSAPIEDRTTADLVITVAMRGMPTRRGPRDVAVQTRQHQESTVRPEVIAGGDAAPPPAAETGLLSDRTPQ
jgi:RNA polymerase sigma-70 factor (ECF subfamily)